MRLIPISVVIAMGVMPYRIHANDLLDAYDNARSSNPALSLSDSLKHSAREEVTLAQAPLLPKVSAKVSLSRRASHASAMAQGWQASGNGPGGTGIPRSAGATLTRSASITVSHSLLALTKYADLKAARLHSYAQDAAYEAELQLLAGRVATAYFRILMNDDALSFARANERAISHQLELAEQRLHAGLSAVIDMQNAKTHQNAARASVINAEKELWDSREALTQITGQPTEALKKLREQPPADLPSPIGSERWASQAVKKSPSILALQYELDSAEQRVSSARARHLPSIDIAVDFRKTSISTHNGSGMPAANSRANDGRGNMVISFLLKIPIFSKIATQSGVRQAIRQRDAAQDELESTRRQLERDIQSRYRSVLGGISKINSTKSAVDSSSGALHATRAGLEVGTRSLADVLAAELNLTLALGNYSRARHQFVLDKLLLKQAAGAVELSDIKAINSLLR